MTPSVSIGPFPRTSIPAEIAAATGQKLEIVAVAAGEQVYRCDLKVGRPGGPVYEWAFLAPEAILRDPAGKYLGKTYAGPTWEAEDGSKVIGTIDARRDAPDKSSIPWLRLKARSIGGNGVLHGVTTVLRVSTTGGAPPPSGCSDAQRGRIVRIDYTADYYFYVNR